MTSSFDDFLDTIGKYPLLEPSEEIELARAVQAWLPLRQRSKLSKSERRIALLGRRAYDKFFCANLRLVVFVAKRYVIKTRSMTIDDLIQEGCMGLARSIEKFDPERGYKFSTYSYWWIRQSVARGIETYDRMIRLPTIGVQTLAKLRKYSLDHFREYGKYPSKAACQAHCGVSEHLFEAYIAHLDGCASLNAKINDESHASELIDVVVDRDHSVDHDTEYALLSDDLRRWMLKLNGEEQDLLRRRYGLGAEVGMSLQDLGNSMHLSREAVRHKELQILRKLRMHVTCDQ